MLGSLRWDEQKSFQFNVRNLHVESEARDVRNRRRLDDAGNSSRLLLDFVDFKLANFKRHKITEHSNKNP